MRIALYSHHYRRHHLHLLLPFKEYALGLCSSWTSLLLLELHSKAIFGILDPFILSKYSPHGFQLLLMSSVVGMTFNS